MVLGLLWLKILLFCNKKKDLPLFEREAGLHLRFGCVHRAAIYGLSMINPQRQYLGYEEVLDTKCTGIQACQFVEGDGTDGCDFPGLSNTGIGIADISKGHKANVVAFNIAGVGNNCFTVINNRDTTSNV